MKVIMTLVLVLVLAGCAAGQGGAGRTLAEETTANGTEETTAYNEETTVLKGGGGRVRPPDSTLSYGGQEVKGELGSYCWSRGSSGLCADTAGVWPGRKRTLTVPSGSEVVFHFGGQAPPDRVNATASSPPDKVMASASPWPEKGASTASTAQNRRRSLKAHGSGVERTIPVELPPGEYLLNVIVLTQQGDAGYAFRIMVK
jgi:hypothetical protein